LIDRFTGLGPCCSNPHCRRESTRSPHQRALVTRHRLTHLPLVELLKPSGDIRIRRSLIGGGLLLLNPLL
jgi:hypothetical protein